MDLFKAYESYSYSVLQVERTALEQNGMAWNGLLDEKETEMMTVLLKVS